MLQTQSPEFKLLLTLAAADSIDSQIRFILSLAASLEWKREKSFKDFPFSSRRLKGFLKPNAKLFNIKMMEVFIIHKAAADVKEPLFMDDKKAGHEVIFTKAKYYFEAVFIMYSERIKTLSNRFVSCVIGGSSVIFQQHLSALWNISSVFVY